MEPPSFISILSCATPGNLTSKTMIIFLYIILNKFLFFFQVPTPRSEEDSQWVSVRDIEWKFDNLSWVTPGTIWMASGRQRQ